MKPLYTQQEYENAKYNHYLKLQCEQCNTIFNKKKTLIKEVVNGVKPNNCRYCSTYCMGQSHIRQVEITCAMCGKTKSWPQAHLRVHKKRNHTNTYCSRSCRARYRMIYNPPSHQFISQLERWIQDKLQSLYPKLDILYNDRTTIRSELDIYIPSLKLAFGLNGPYHYEPIYGLEALKYTQNNDNRKFQACLEQGIELCIIDSSKQGRFKESTSQPYLDIIMKIIDLKLNNVLPA